MIEPDEMDFRRNLEICMPYLGPVVGEYSDWTPLFDRGELFEEDLDRSDPWQFKNVLVVSVRRRSRSSICHDDCGSASSIWRRDLQHFAQWRSRRRLRARSEPADAIIAARARSAGDGQSRAARRAS